MLPHNKKLRELFNKAQVVPVRTEIRHGACFALTADGRVLKLSANPHINPATIAYVRKVHQPGVRI